MCNGGQLPDHVLLCPSLDSSFALQFTTFEVYFALQFEYNLIVLCLKTVEVETYGKGKEYTRIEPVKTQLSLDDFKQRFKELFREYSHHIVISWYLANCKLELQLCRPSRSKTMFIVSDFAENVVVVRKYELSDQYFHRYLSSPCSFHPPYVGVSF